jgi:F-box-like
MSQQSLSLIDSLPDEILGDIFLSYIRHIRHIHSPRASRPRVFSVWKGGPCTPILLGQVSTRWRAVSHSTPRLWSFIIIIETAHAPLHRGDVLTILMWLEKSKLAPLHLFFFFSLESSQSCPHRRQIFQAACAHAGQWRAAQIGGLDDSDLEDVPSLDMPHLWHFEIGLRTGESSALSRRFVSNLSTAPRLSHVWLDSSWSSPSWVPGLSWSTLQWLALGQGPSSPPLSANAWVQMLQNCEDNLRELLCRVTFEDSNWPILRQPICLTALTTLMFYVVCFSAPMALRCVSLPGLQIAVIVVSHPILLNPSWEAITDLGHRSQWSLKCLRFGYRRRQHTPGYASMNATNCETFTLPQFSTISHLTLAFPIAGKALESLAFRGTARPFPNVQRLDLDHCDDASEEAMFDTLQSRVRGVEDPNLIDVRIDDRASIESSLPEKLPELRFTFGPAEDMVRV